jgi:hypothetical protein
MGVLLMDERMIGIRIASPALQTACLSIRQRDSGKAYLFSVDNLKDNHDPTLPISLARHRHRTCPGRFAMVIETL